MTQMTQETRETLPLSGCSFGWLHLAPLPDALRVLARHGFRSVELTTAPPHLSAPGLGPYERQELARLLDALGLRVTSVNPSFADINLISTIPEFRELSERHLIANVELAADLGAPYVVVIPGRRHALAPAPDQAARTVLDQGLDRLLARAEPLGVTITLENSPYGYLGRASELAEIAARWDSPWLRLTYDVANALAIEDPAEGVRQAARYLALAHVSDTWRNKWAHTAAGTAEVDFGGFARALAEVGFAGPTVYELVDGLDPEPRLADGLGTLAAAGWAP
jgi:sugar phosphate isomerase/epimerase